MQATHAVYQFAIGPGAWLAFGLFFGGCLYKFIRMLVLTYQKEAFMFSIFSFKYSMRSILHWMTPFATVNMRRHPVMTIVTFVFHICLFLAPIFLLSHLVLLDEAWNFKWWALPDSAADIMTAGVVLACIFFLVRRLTSPEVQYVTSAADYWILAVVAMPFISGFWAYHQFPGYDVAVLVHIISGEIMLVAIPFTRLSHMIFAPFTRAYTGSEFGAFRHARDW